MSASALIWAHFALPAIANLSKILFLSKSVFVVLSILRTISAISGEKIRLQKNKYFLQTFKFFK